LAVVLTMGLAGCGATHASRPEPVSLVYVAVDLVSGACLPAVQIDTEGLRPNMGTFTSVRLPREKRRGTTGIQVPPRGISCSAWLDEQGRLEVAASLCPTHTEDERAATLLKPVVGATAILTLPPGPRPRFVVCAVIVNRPASRPADHIGADHEERAPG